MKNKMKNYEILFNQFRTEYYKPNPLDMAVGIKQLLSTPTFYYPMNSDWQYLNDQMDSLISESVQELPNRVYNMFFSAFSYLVDYIVHTPKRIK